MSTNNRVIVRVREGKSFDAVVPLEGGNRDRRNIERQHGAFECRKHVLESFPHTLEEVSGGTASFSIIPPGDVETGIATSPPADDVAKNAGDADKQEDPGHSSEAE